MKYAFVNGVILDGTQDMEPQSGKIILVDGEKITAIVDAGADISGYEKNGTARSGFPQQESDISAVWYLLNNFWEPLEEVVLSGRYNVQKSGYPEYSYQLPDLTFRPGETGIALLYFLLQEKFEHVEIFGKNQQ